MAGRLSNKVAVVTGAGQGIGQAIARALSAEGAVVVAVDLKQAVADATVASMDNEGLALACDVADSSSVIDCFKQVEARFGRLDILVNNAGIGMAAGDGSDIYQQRMAERAAQLAAGETPTVYADHTIDMADEGWLAVMNVNINGTFYCCREALRLMSRHNTAGSIINISSTSALCGEGGAHYCASKAAILGLTKSLAQEVGARGIRVNAVAPGPTMTPAMAGISEQWQQQIAAGVLLGRLAQPEEIAQTAVFLASDDSSYYTGQTLCANGGMYLL
jgi:3-oxoacyl-[acyl-carrier protein] reductase